MPCANRSAHLNSCSTVPLIPSATIVLLRDSACLEVLLLTRQDTASFGGASVFPGGKVDAEDGATSWASRCDGLTQISVEDRAFYIGAIREAFEEAGLLLARSEGSTHLLSCADSAKIAARYRDELLCGKIAFAEIVERENLRLACDLLIPLARWFTPAIAPKRFDTFFFLAAAPNDCTPTADGMESSRLDWLAPQTAIDESETGTRRVVFPTRATLSKLALYASVAEAIVKTQQRGLVHIEPEIRTEAQGTMICLPPEAGYPIYEVPLAAVFDPRNYPNTESQTQTANTDDQKA